MTPDLATDRLRAWGTCAGSAAVAAGLVAAVWYGADVPAVLAQVEKERQRVARIAGEPIEERIRAQQESNQALGATIGRLMDQTRFEIARDFQVPSDASERIEIEPGYRWKDRFLQVRQKVRDAAKPGSIERGEYLGFPDAVEVPPASQVPGMLAMLQLVEKISMAICATQPWTERFDIKPGVPVDAGPQADGKALIREYPLTLTIRGELESIMRVLWRMAQIQPVPDRDARPYPLVIKGLVINSENVTARDGINQLTAVVELAALEYQRTVAASAVSDRSGGAPGATPTPVRSGGARP